MAPGSVSVAVKEPTMVPVGWFSRMESAPFAFKLLGGVFALAYAEISKV